MKSRFALLATVFVAFGVSFAAADKKPATVPDRAVLTFVKKHHPELAMLLSRLKKDSAAEYKKAVGETRAVVERLDRLAERQPSRAEYEIGRWKVDSRIRLLTARMISLMGESTEGVEHPDLVMAREELRSLSEQRVRLERDRLERDRKAYADRLAKIDEQANRIDKDFDAAVSRQMSVLSRGIDAAAKKRGIDVRRTKKKPASAEKNESSPKSGNRPAA